MDHRKERPNGKKSSTVLEKTKKKSKKRRKSQKARVRSADEAVGRELSNDSGELTSHETESDCPLWHKKKMKPKKQMSPCTVTRPVLTAISQISASKKQSAAKLDGEHFAQSGLAASMTALTLKENQKEKKSSTTKSEIREKVTSLLTAHDSASLKLPRVNESIRWDNDQRGGEDWIEAYKLNRRKRYYNAAKAKGLSWASDQNFYSTESRQTADSNNTGEVLAERLTSQTIEPQDHLIRKTIFA